MNVIQEEVGFRGSRGREEVYSFSPKGWGSHSERILMTERERESVCLLRGCSKGSIEGVLRELKGCGEGVK